MNSGKSRGREEGRPLRCAAGLPPLPGLLLTAARHLGESVPASPRLCPGSGAGTARGEQLLVAQAPGDPACSLDVSSQHSQDSNTSPCSFCSFLGTSFLARTPGVRNEGASARPPPSSCLLLGAPWALRRPPPLPRSVHSPVSLSRSSSSRQSSFSFFPFSLLCASLSSSRFLPSLSLASLSLAFWLPRPSHPPLLPLLPVLLPQVGAEAFAPFPRVSLALPSHPARFPAPEWRAPPRPPLARHSDWPAPH